ncbi:MAG: hypothetical protein PPP58_02250 [Natronomonas sp.]
MSEKASYEQQFGKNVLFCSGCEHSNPITGDWVLEVHEIDAQTGIGTGSWLAYRCPECSQVVTRRPHH